MLVVQALGLLFIMNKEMVGDKMSGEKMITILRWLLISKGWE